MIGIIVGLAAEGRLARPLGGMVAVGGGEPRGAARAAHALAAAGVTGLLSFGLAGGLAPQLSAGTLLVPEFVLAEDGARWLTDPDLAARFGRRAGTVFAASATIATAADKQQAWLRTQAEAVDLESGEVARAAAAHQLPFAVVRAICDPAATTLPPAAVAALSSGGRIRVLAVLQSVLSRPRQIPDLLQLARAAAAARRTLRKRVAMTGALD